MDTMRSAKNSQILIAALGIAMLVAGCASPASGSPRATGPQGPTITVSARPLAHVGEVLVDSHGYALYMFVPDAQKQVTCAGLCAATWPPLKVPADATLAAGPGVRSALLGSDADPAGGRVVTYDGWPLYTYSGDVSPGQITGQGIDLNGGDWFLMRPTGQPLTQGLLP
jgi:predicted lipoprotein with Yx(FWY)xxD motif